MTSITNNTIITGNTNNTIITDITNIAIVTINNVVIFVRSKNNKDILVKVSIFRSILINTLAL